MDSGSLNGTMLNGSPIGCEGRRPGDRVALAHDDTVDFGSVTRCQLRCQPSRGPRRGGVEAAAAAADAAATQGAQGARAATWHGVPELRRPLPASSSYGHLLLDCADGAAGCAGSPHAEGHDGAHGSPGAGGAGVPPPAPLELAFPACGVEAAVLQRVGAEHRRQGTCCEDVAAWEAPLPGRPQVRRRGGRARACRLWCCPRLLYAPRWNCSADPCNPLHCLRPAQAGIFCIFDGHHGRSAAAEAAALLPAQLLARLPPPRLLADADAAAPALEAAFLETDRLLTSDEGCTATVVLVEAAAALAGPSGGSDGAGDGSSGLQCSSSAAGANGNAAGGGDSGSGSGGGGGGGVVLQVANVGDSEAILVDLSSG
jgi:hypothetical protein